MFSSSRLYLCLGDYSAKRQLVRQSRNVPTSALTAPITVVWDIHLTGVSSGGMDQPRAGTHYPRSTGEFQAWFRTDADCLDYLDWVRWPGGFTGQVRGHAESWRLGDARYECAACYGRTSVTAGTIFDRTRTPLTVWFTACWLFATQKDGISAQSLQRSLEIGSYPTAWAMLHRLRSVLVRPGRDRLAGIVEVDETYIGGDEPCEAAGPRARRCSPASRSRWARRRGSAGAGWRYWPTAQRNR